MAPEPAFLPPAAGAGQVAAVWRDRLSLLLESTGEGIFGIDMAGCCVFVNRSAAQVLGWPAEAIIGRNMHALIHHTHADGRHYPEADCPIFKAFRQGQPCRIDDEVFWRADGSAFFAEYTSHPIVENGMVQGAVVTLVDITQRREAQALLDAARRVLGKSIVDGAVERTLYAHFCAGPTARAAATTVAPRLAARGVRGGGVQGLQRVRPPGRAVERTARRRRRWRRPA